MPPSQKALDALAQHWENLQRARIEDLLWMAETGEHAEGAARRLGIGYDALERFARRHTPDTWAVLLARKPSLRNQSNHGSAA